MKTEGLMDESGQANRPDENEKGKAGERFKIEIFGLYFIISSNSFSWHTGGHCRTCDLFLV